MMKTDGILKCKAAVAGLVMGLVASVSMGALAKTTLTFSHWYDWPAVQTFLAASIAKFEKTHREVTVKQSVIPFSTYIEKLLTMSVAGKLPDVVMVSGVWMGTANGVLTDIDSLVKQGKFDKTVAYDSMWRNTTWKGSAYAIPFGGGVGRTLYWNKDMFVKAGMDPDRPPVTWDEFLSAIKILTVDRNNDGKPEVFGTDWATPCVQMLHIQAGGDITTENGLGTDFNTTAGVKAFEFLQALGRLRTMGSY